MVFKPSLGTITRTQTRPNTHTLTKMTSTTIHEPTFRSMDSKPDWVPRALHDKSVRIYYCRFNVRKEDAGFILGTRGFKINRFKRDTGANIRLVHTEYEMPHFLIESMSHDSVRSALHSIGAEAHKASTSTQDASRNRPQQPPTVHVSATADFHRQGRYAAASSINGSGLASIHRMERQRCASAVITTNTVSAHSLQIGPRRCSSQHLQLRKQQPPRPTSPPSRPTPPVFNAEAAGIRGLPSRITSQVAPVPLLPQHARSSSLPLATRWRLR